MSSLFDIDALTAFVRTHAAWASVIVGIMCFLESLVFVSILVPATLALVAIGTLVGAGLISWHDVVIGGVIGCILGDTVSYWIGRILGPHARTLWPFTRFPDMLPKGEAFFARHGWWGVFVGRFLGPLRAIVPTCAGIMRMPHWAFQLVSITSALVFVPLWLAPGALVMVGAEATATGRLNEILPLLFVGGLVVGAITLWLVSYRRSHIAELPDETKRG